VVSGRDLSLVLRLSGCNLHHVHLVPRLGRRDGDGFGPGARTRRHRGGYDAFIQAFQSEPGFQLSPAS